MTSDILIIRTISNLMIIGYGTKFENTTIIEKPYNVIPAMDGLQLYPLDAELIGKEIPQMEIHNSNTIYITEPGDNLIESYKKATSSIELGQEKKLILG